MIVILVLTSMVVTLYLVLTIFDHSVKNYLGLFHYAMTATIAFIGLFYLNRVKEGEWRIVSGRGGMGRRDWWCGGWVSLPLGAAYGVAVWQVIRYEYMIDLFSMKENSVSSIHLYVFMISVSVGVIMRHGITTAVTALMLILVFVRGVLHAATMEDGWSATLDLLSRILGVVFTAAYCHIGSYHQCKMSRRNFVRGKRIKLQLQKLEKHRKLVANLLALMLPASVIHRIETSHSRFSSIVDAIDQAYCIFIDIDNGLFISCPPTAATPTMQNQGQGRLIHPEDDIQKRVKIINACFKEFDQFLSKWPEFEKIKTISTKILLILPVNDSVGVTLDVAARKLTDFACAVKDLFLRRRIGIDESMEEIGGLAQRQSAVIEGANGTVGIAFGNVVAGLVGNSKFCYDVYGDQVNTASRMQSLGIHDIVCTKEAYNTLSPPHNFMWKSLGEHNVKGKGMMEVYGLFVTSETEGEYELKRLSKSVKESSVFQNTEKSFLQLLAQNPYLTHDPSDIGKDIGVTGMIESRFFDDRENARDDQNPLSMLDVSGIYIPVTVSSKNLPTYPTGASKLFLNASGLCIKDEMVDDRTPLEAMRDSLGRRARGGANVTNESGAKKTPKPAYNTPLPDLPIDRINIEDLTNDIYKLIDTRTCTFRDPVVEAFYTEVSILEIARRKLVSSVLGFATLVGLTGLAVMLEGRKDPEGFTQRFPVVVALPVMCIAQVVILFVHARVYGMVQFAGKGETCDIGFCKACLTTTFSFENANFLIFILVLGFTSEFGKLQDCQVALTLLMVIFSHYSEPPNILFAVRAGVIIVITAVAASLFLALGTMQYVDVMDVVASVVCSCLGSYSQRFMTRADVLIGHILMNNEMQTKNEMATAATLLKAVLPSRLIKKWVPVARNMSDIVESFKCKKIILSSNIDLFKAVTVLYLDVVSFTVLSSGVSAIRLIEILVGRLMVYVTLIKPSIPTKITEYNILTIGDAYMASILDGMDVSKSPTSETIRRNAHTVCQASLEIQAAMQKFADQGTFSDVTSIQIPAANRRGSLSKCPALQIRLGVHTGSGLGFVSGGTSMIKYELVGEVVDVAMKIQDAGRPGSVFVSSCTKYWLDPARTKLDPLPGVVILLDSHRKEEGVPEKADVFLLKECLPETLGFHSNALSVRTKWKGAKGGGGPAYSQVMATAELSPKQ
ncbi:hypothetical protein HDU97_010048 [Phlyctochytrium planicorne]|nr:hypothetical protein HDU97_010048 [Phlyctochytrium planicorne]